MVPWRDLWPDKVLDRNHGREHAMSIIVSRDGKNAKKLDRSVIAEESYLQQYIYDNPEACRLMS